MKFTGFMDGLKSICYYDAATRSIKVSWNFAFNENDDLNELESYTDLPDLVAVKGEELFTLPHQFLVDSWGFHQESWESQESTRNEPGILEW